MNLPVNFLNRLRFDRIIVMSLWSSFLVYAMLWMRRSLLTRGWCWPLVAERRTKPFSSRPSCNFRCTAERRRYLQRQSHKTLIHYDIRSTPTLSGWSVLQSAGRIWAQWLDARLRNADSVGLVDPPPVGRGAEYCDEQVCLSFCLSASISQKPHF